MRSRKPPPPPPTPSTSSAASSAGSSTIPPTDNNSVAIPVDNGKPKVIIRFRNVNKEYPITGGGTLKALDNFSCDVSSGEIFALMGPSGAGKSTSVAVAMGIDTADNGKVIVLGKDLSKSTPQRNLMGYMPQVGLELGMYPSFTIKETFHYFGRQNGLTSDMITEKLTFFTENMGLPPDGKLIRGISGGQQRLVCYATAILHNPKLLILDEPTVGLDYALKKRIWTSIETLVTGGSTVLIVTHDCEEAMKSNRIGLMRNGRMLALGAPEEVIKSYNTEDLEDAFLEICLLDEFSRQREAKSRIAQIEGGEDDDDEACEIEDVPVLVESSKECLPLATISAEGSSKSKDSISSEESEEVDHQSPHFNLSDEDVLQATYGTEPPNNLRSKWIRIQGMIIKNIVMMRHTLITCLFVCLIPCIQNLAVCHSMGLNPRIKIGVVNLEIANFSNECPTFSSCKAYKNASVLSCLFLNYTASDQAKFVFYETDANAEAAVQQGEVMGYISFKAEFSRAFYKNLENEMLSDEDIKDKEVYMGYDATDAIARSFFIKTIISGYMSFGEKVKSGCGIKSAMGKELYKFEKSFFGDYEQFSTYMAVSILFGLLWFFPLAAGTSMMIAERAGGTYTRSVIAGTTPVEMLLANMIRPLLYTVVQILLCRATLLYIEGYEMKGNILILVYLSTCMGIVGEIIGFLFGVCIDNHVMAAFLLLATYFPNLMLAGMVWPITTVHPEWVQWILWLLPASMPARAFRDVAVRGLTISDRPVYLGVITVTFWIFLSSFVFFVIMRRKRRLRV